MRGEKMTRAGQEVLTERESADCEHRRQAQALGVGLAEYCRRQRLRVEEWYQIKRDFVRKGMANGRAGAADRSEDRHASFVPMHVTAAATVSQTVTIAGFERSVRLGQFSMAVTPVTTTCGGRVSSKTARAELAGV